MLILSILLVFGLPLHAVAQNNGFCYDPFHNPKYPLNNNGNKQLASQFLSEDFSRMKNYGVRLVRTYYSSHFGEPVVPHAAANGIQLFLGVYMTDQAWGQEQIDMAISGVKNNPGTVKAILVGNENAKIGGFGTDSVDKIIGVINKVKDGLRRAGVHVPVGSAQRINEWLNDGAKPLAAACDIIGVHIYPFFTNGWNPSQPTQLIDIQWQKLIDKYPNQATKLHLTESGWPTQGPAPAGLPNNIPSIANAKAMYNGLRRWVPRGGGNKFYFSFFDRRQGEPILQTSPSYEQYFGVATANGVLKFSIS